MSRSVDQQVIVVGACLSGLATALGAAVRGLRVTILEAADLLGGAAAYSGGQVWIAGNHVAARDGIDDDPDRGMEYVRGLAARDPGFLNEEALKTWMTTAPVAARYWEELGAIRWEVIEQLVDYQSDVPGSMGVGRYLTNTVLDGTALGQWRSKLRVSPHFPVGRTYTELMEGGRANKAQSGALDVHGLGGGKHLGAATTAGDPLTFGTGVVASFLARLIREPSVSIQLERRVTALTTDALGRVTGVQAEGPDGTETYRGSVVLATSTYDWDEELVAEMTGLPGRYFGSIAPSSVRGDAIRLVREIGGAVLRLPPTSIPMLPGWRLPDGSVDNGPEFAKPHAIIVDAHGRRFCNDSHWPDIVDKALGGDDRRLPMYLIWDEQHHRKYGLGNTPPGTPYPEGLVATAESLTDLATDLGIDPEGLQSTVHSFNIAAVEGHDPEFGRGTSDYVHRFYADPRHRPNSALGPIERAPFHGVPLIFVGTGIGMSGVSIDARGAVLSTEGTAVPGLYAVGSCTASTAAGVGYNSGFALGRGITLAYLVSQALSVTAPQHEQGN